MRVAHILAAALALVAAPTLAAAQPAAGADNLWLNPHGSVAVRTGACGGMLCGWIVWANRDAAGDAKASGVSQLVGTQLLQDYRPDGVRRWSGTVFVPNMGKRFMSQINQLSST